MNITQMEYIVAVVEESTLTAAAERLHVTQPALSRSIQRIEEEIGHPLFERSGRNILLNEYGEILYRFSRKTVNDYNTALAQIRELSRESSNALNVGVSGYVYSLPIIMSFQNLYPDIRLSNFKFYAKDFPDIVYQKDVDCLLSVLDYKAEDVESFLLSRDPIYAALPADHPLAVKKTIRLEELKGEPLIMSSGETLFYQSICDMYHLIGAEPVIKNRMATAHLIQMLGAGVGTSIINKETVASLPPTGKCTAVRLEDEFCFTSVYVIYRRQGKKSESLRQFLKFAEEYNVD